MDDEEIRDLFEAKVRRGIFNPIERHLRPDLCEDRMAEALGLTFELFRERAKRGELVDDALLVHHAKLRALDCSRCLVKGYCQRARDVLDYRPFIAGKVRVLRLDGLVDDDDQEHDAEGDRELVGLAAELAANPVGKIISALNLSEWIAQLAPADRELLELRAEGHGLAEIASITGRSVTFACHRLHELGEQLAAHAELPTLKRTRKRRSTSNLLAAA